MFEKQIKNFHFIWKVLKFTWKGYFFSLLDACTLCLLCGTTNDYAVAQWNSCALFCWIMFLFFVLFSQPCWHCHAWQLITDSNWNKDDRRRWTKNSIYWFKVNFTSCLFRLKLYFYAPRAHLEQLLVTSFLPSPANPISDILIFIGISLQFFQFLSSSSVFQKFFRATQVFFSPWGSFRLPVFVLNLDFWME